MADVNEQKVREVLGRHGYGFHHAVIREIRAIESRTRHATWADDGTEFPIEVNGFNGQVDLLLRSRRGLLVCECKRVDPVLGIWCFARSALATRYVHEQDKVAHETVAYDESAGRTYVVRHDSRVATSVQYHVAHEIKTNEKGEAHGTSRGALEDSISQALRAVNGITNAIAADRRLLPGNGPLTLIPVIITTARLVTCDTDLSTADIKTGRLRQHRDHRQQRRALARRAADQRR